MWVCSSSKILRTHFLHHRDDKIKLVFLEILLVLKPNKAKVSVSVIF